jgi:transmembrane sensor
MMMAEDDILEEAALWLSRMRADAFGPEQARDLKIWLARDPRNTAALDVMMAVWDQAAPLAQTPVVKAELERVERRAAQRARMQWSWGGGGLAAAGMAVAALIFVQPREQTYRTAVGQVVSIALADHSTVWLDTNTQVKVALSPVSRHVVLERGAAEFQVAHDAVRPFSVSTPSADIRDTGTDFFVRRDADDARVVLISGAVTITRPDGAVQTGLRPGQALRIPRAGPMSLSEAVPEAEMAWRDGRLVFYQRPLADVVAEFARYEHLTVRFADPAAGRLSVSGTYRAKDFNSFLKAMIRLYGIDSYTDNKAEVVIRSPG